MNLEAKRDIKWRKKGNLGEPKEDPNRWKIGPKWVWTATWSKRGDGDRQKGCDPHATRHVGTHFGSQMGVKLEPKVVKTAIKNASKFHAHFNMLFWGKEGPNGANMGAKMVPTWSQSRSKKRRKRNKRKMWKLCWRLSGSTKIRVGPCLKNVDLIDKLN